MREMVLAALGVLRRVLVLAVWEMRLWGVWKGGGGVILSERRA